MFAGGGGARSHVAACGSLSPRAELSERVDPGPGRFERFERFAEAGARRDGCGGAGAVLHRCNERRWL